MTTHETDRTLQRNIESARPLSFVTLESYTTARDATLSRASPLMVALTQAAFRLVQKTLFAWPQNRG